MKKKIFRVMLTALSAILLLTALVVVCAAEKTLVAEGYCVTSVSGAATQTNIKWEIFEEEGEQTIYFNIDQSKDDTNTVLHAKDKGTGADIPFYKADSGTMLPWGSYTAKGDSKVSKAVIGEGITEISGAAFVYSAIKTVEVPKTLATIGNAAFNRATRLSTVNITGEDPNPGVVNLKYVTTISNNSFGGENSVTKYEFNPDYVGVLGNEAFSKNNMLREMEIPAGVTALGDNSFTGSVGISYLTILGKDTVLTEKTFGGLSVFPKIIGYSGSAAEQFAKSNGYTFIDIETQKVVNEGTKPHLEDNDSLFLDTTGATANGHITGFYDGRIVVNTYWAYYSETKTLKLVTGTTNYNETGRIAMADDEKGWSDYLEEIEHIVIGDYISKLSNELCHKMPNLKSIELSSNTTEMGSDVFNGCNNLTTIYYRGKQKTEGLADFSAMKLVSSLKGTNIKTLKLGKDNEDLDGVILPVALETIITPHYDSEFFDTLCKDYAYDLQDLNNPNNIKKYGVKIVLDPNWIMCGASTAFEFNEATGTLTVHGKGTIDDIDNYYGGGSKHQPWFSIRDNVKHIVITDYVKTIGKYAFCEFVNLETVCLPNTDKITILNGAFEKCYNLKSIYVDGTEAIEGTFDLRLVKEEFVGWTFAYDYLVANIIVDESVTKIAKTTFEENLGVNLTGVYGVPGSFAETYAADKGLTFYDISKGMPSPVTCTPPEIGDDTDVPGDDTTISPDSGDDTIAPDTTDVPDTTDAPDSTGPDTKPVVTPEKPSDGGNDSVVLIVVIVAVVLVVVACVAVFMIKAKKSPKNDK